MPRIVDHGARRHELAAAALEIVGTSGVDALSVRALAARSGWSSGALRHYVPDVDALASLLLDEVAGRIQQRVTGVLREGVAPEHTAEIVVACLEQLLPLDEERRVEFGIWRHFWGRDRRGVESAWVWTGQRMFHRQMVLLLGGAPADTVPQLPGDLPPDLERWAGHLHAFTDGLALRAAIAVPAVTAAEVHEDLVHLVDVVALHVAPLNAIESRRVT